MKYIFMVFVFIILIVLSVVAAGFCFDYSLWCILGKDIPWYADVIAGSIGNGLTVTVAIICWIMRLCGVEIPFVD